MLSKTEPSCEKRPLTLHEVVPANNVSPLFKMPLVTITVATGPLPTSILDSTTYPDALSS